MEVKKMKTYNESLYYRPVFNSITDTEIHLAQEQLNTKPGIDNVICHELDGEALKEALFIINNIRQHKMRIKWSAVNVWSVHSRFRHVCDLSIKNDSLLIGPVNDVLATRVKDMPFTQENINWLIDTLRNPVKDAQETVSYA